MSYYIKQIKKNDCGYTSIKMYLASLSKNKDFLFMQDSKIENLSILELIELLNKYNVEAKAYKNVSKKIIKKIREEFLLINKNENSYHCVMVKKVIFNNLLIYDPEKGIYWMKMKDIINKESIVIFRINKKTKINNYSNELNKLFSYKIYNLFIVIATFLALFSLIFGLYLMNNNMIVQTLILLTLYVLLTLLSQFLTNKLNKIKINKINKYLLKTHDKIGKNLIESNLNYVLKSTNLISTFLINIVSFIFLITLIVLNNYKNLLFIFLMIVYFIISRQILNKKITKTKERLNKFENNLNNCDHIKYDMLNVQISSESNKLFKLLSINKYLDIFYSLIISLSICYFSETLNFISLVFYYILFSTIIKLLDGIIKFNEENNNVKYYLNKIFYYIHNI